MGLGGLSVSADTYRWESDHEKGWDAVTGTAPMLVLADDPEPAPDLDAECEEAVAGLGAVIRRAEAALDALRAPGPHPDGLQIRVQDLNTALIHLAGQAAELRDAEDRRARAVEEDLASRPLAAGLYQAGREDEHAELVAAGWQGPPR